MQGTMHKVTQSERFFQTALTNCFSDYSATLLTHAKQLFNFGTTYRGKYSDSIPNVVDFYK